MRTSTYKVPNGKLIKIKLLLSEDMIDRVTITGDFFLHPESCIESIESALVGSSTDISSLEATITRVLEAESAKLIGASSSDIATAIMLAVDAKS